MAAVRDLRTFYSNAHVKAAEAELANDASFQEDLRRARKRGRMPTGDIFRKDRSLKYLGIRGSRRTSTGTDRACRRTGGRARGSAPS